MSEFGLQFTGCTFEQVLEGMGELAPEVRDKRDALIKGANYLLGIYGVDKSFFRADDNAIGLALASALHVEAAQKTGKSPSKQESDLVIADSFAQTLFGRYSAVYPWEDLRTMSKLSPEGTYKLYARYTDADLSQRLQHWLRTSPEHEALRANGTNDFAVSVLSIGSPLHTKGIGQAAGAPEGIDRYVAELHANGEAFMREQAADPEDAIPYAYVETMHGKRHILIMEPTARILLEPEAIGYQDDGVNRDLLVALTGHELAHTKGSVALKDLEHPQEMSFIGQLLEEYRAEVLSGLKFASQYPDIYETIRFVDEYGRVNIAEIMRSLPCGGGLDRVEAYGTLAQHLGLNTAAKLAGLLPEDYIAFQSPKSSRVLYEALDKGYLMNAIVEGMSDNDLESYLASKKLAPDVTSEIRGWLQGIRQAARS